MFWGFGFCEGFLVFSCTLFFWFFNFFTSKSDWSRNFSHCGIAKGKRFGTGTNCLYMWLGWSLDGRTEKQNGSWQAKAGREEENRGRKRLERCTVSERSSPREGFLIHSTPDVSSWVILRGRGCLMPCSGIRSLCPLPSSLWQPEMPPDIAKRPLENHWVSRSGCRHSGCLSVLRVFVCPADDVEVISDETSCSGTCVSCSVLRVSLLPYALVDSLHSCFPR